MRTRAICIAAMIATTGLCAQDAVKKAPDQGAMPNPKTEHHAALKRWTGTWKVTGKMDAIPGVPGMEKPVESTGTESASLLCDGLWLKWESEMICDGKRSTGLWLVGYDPFRKQYISYVVSSDEQCQGLTPLTGEYDKKTDTWTWIGATPQGKMKSVCEFSGPDSLKETLYMVGPDGKEKQFMVMNRVRSKAAKSSPVVDASLKEKPKVAASKHHAALLQDVGTWDAIVESTYEGETTKEKGIERVQAICDDRWTWSVFQSQYQGKPFTGHALVGWDAGKKQYVSLWIDSMSATVSVTTGTFDEKAKTYSFSGSCTGPDGKPMKIEQSLACKDKDSRVLRMKFDSPAMKSTMKITYKRRSEK
jgi:hypothetical protein